MRNALSFIALSIGAASCGVFGSGDEDSPPPPPAAPPANNNNGGTGPAAPPPPPPEGIPLVGVFTSSSKGVDENDGTVTRPVKTLKRGMELSKLNGQPVIACAETFNEAVTLINGVTLYGYFDCSGVEWKRVETHAVVNSPTSPAVLADKLDLQARIEGFDFNAPDIGGKAAVDKVAQTSIGMVIKGSKGLELASINIRGGNAEAGADGAESAVQNTDRKNQISGLPSNQTTGCGDIPLCNAMQYNPTIGPGNTSDCPFGVSGGPGGRGGDGLIILNGAYRAPGAGATFPGQPAVATPQTAKGGSHSGPWGPQTNGDDGTPGAVGAAGGNGAWSVTDDGFAPGNGTQGAIGSPGQGGGGGGGAFAWRDVAGVVINPPTTGYAWTGTGGGGGAGGCGGLPGTAGKGGGASIGLHAIDSQFTIKSSRIESRAGGGAGKGALGQAGYGGFIGGALVSYPTAGGFGGDGGRGGAAGPSGHGSAGPSIAFAFKGTRPNVDATVTLTPGTPGAGQAALVRDDKIVPAVVGEAKAEHGF